MRFPVYFIVTLTLVGPLVGALVLSLVALGLAVLDAPESTSIISKVFGVLLIQLSGCFMWYSYVTFRNENRRERIGRRGA